MTVTALKNEKKHLTRVLFNDDTEILLDSDICAESSLIRVGRELSSEELKELKEASDYKRAKSRALWYLDRMDYTEKALFDKLLKAGFSKKASARVLARLCELGVVDDRRYAERFIERCNENNISKREAMHKMLLKGIPYDLARELLSENECDEACQIENLLNGKYAYKLTCEKGPEKVFAALARKGFSFSEIRKAMKKYTEIKEFEDV